MLPTSFCFIVCQNSAAIVFFNVSKSYFWIFFVSCFAILSVFFFLVNSQSKKICFFFEKRKKTQKKRVTNKECKPIKNGKVFKFVRAIPWYRNTNWKKIKFTTFFLRLLQILPFLSICPKKYVKFYVFWYFVLFCFVSDFAGIFLKVLVFVVLSPFRIINIFVWLCMLMHDKTKKCEKGTNNKKQNKNAKRRKGNF